jgi:hypothetical protein
VRWRTSAGATQAQSLLMVNEEAVMSKETKDIRSEIGFDRSVRRVAVLVSILYVVGCAGITYLHLSHL